MQEDSPRRSVGPVIFYLICLFCLFAIFGIGWYGMETQQRYYREANAVREVNDDIQTARRLFVAMQMLSAQRTLQRDVSLTLKRQEIDLEFAEIIRRCEGMLASSENQRLAQEIEEGVARYAAYDKQSSDLLMEQEKIRYEWVAITDTLTKVVFDLSERAAQRMHEAKIEHENALFLPEQLVQRILAIKQILREVQDQRRMMLILNFEPNTEKRQVIAQELSAQFAQMAEMLAKFQKSVVPEEKKLLEDVIKIFAQYRNVGESMVAAVVEADQIGAEKDLIAAKVTDDFDALQANYRERLSFVEDDAYHTAQSLRAMLLASAMVAIVLCLVSGYFLAVRGKNTAVRSNPYDPYSTDTETSRDLSAVAGKLQEVVDMLRR